MHRSVHLDQQAEAASRQAQLQMMGTPVNSRTCSHLSAIRSSPGRLFRLASSGHFRWRIAGAKRRRSQPISRQKRSRKIRPVFKCRLIRKRQTC